jgi:hypothetical protein
LDPWVTLTSLRWLSLKRCRWTTREVVTTSSLEDMSIPHTNYALEQCFRLRNGKRSVGRPIDCLSLLSCFHPSVFRPYHHCSLCVFFFSFLPFGFW